MKDWFTTAELAALALPGLPKTRFGWDQLAEREGWGGVAGKVRARDGRGGGMEYHADLLPGGALAAYAMRIVGKVVVAESDRLCAEAGESEQLALPALDHRDARLALLAAADRFFATGVYSRVLSDQTFCALYNLGKIEVEPWVLHAVRKLAPRSLKRWRAMRFLDGANALAVDRGAARRGSGGLDRTEVRSWLLGFLAHKPHTSARSAHDYLIAQFPGLRVSPRSVARALSGLKSSEKVALTRITNPDAWKSKYEPSGQNGSPASRLNELWQIDASPADVLLTTGRHSIYACIDRFSRRTIIYVTRTPRAEAVCLLLRRAMLLWGVPERIKTDNGSDFKAKRVVGLLAALEIEVSVSAPFDPKAKAHVERVIGTFQHDCASDLPGFIGHNVGDRKVIEERRAFAQRLGETDDNIFCVELDAKGLQERADHWAQVRYEHRAHGGLGGKSPAQVAAGFAGKLKKIEDLHALDMLLAPIAGGDGIRTTTKKGVRVDNSSYYTPSILAGERVLVRMDPADLGRVYCFTPDGVNFLGEGLCPELAGVDPFKAVAEFKRQQAELLAERTAPIRRELRQLKKDKPALAEAIARREAEAAGKLIAFPKPTENYSTPALAAAAGARAPSSGPSDHLLPQGEKDAREDLRAAVEADLAPAAPPLAKVAVLPETRQQRFRRALALEADMKSGAPLAAADADWLLGYVLTAEYQGLKTVYDDFGEAAL
ncbi:DDE-type integrase/transposase/recombinase [Rhodoblastus sp.]|uniref:DDE-type integrase/transposase/recombinase n=1 Tax=Rhodoblastus sp. TaxID=1962975 RepID=UPI003F9A9D8E